MTKRKERCFVHFLRYKMAIPQKSFFKHRRYIMPKATDCEGFMSPKGKGRRQPMVDKNFCISNWQSVWGVLYCWRDQITNSTKGGDYYDENLYQSDCLRIACSVLNVRLIYFFRHIRSRVCFLFAKQLLAQVCCYAPVGVLLPPSWGLFLWKALEYASNGKFDNRKGEFFMTSPLMHLIEFEEERRRCPWRD